MIWLIWLLSACKLVREGKLDTRLPREVNLGGLEVRSERIMKTIIIYA